MDFDWWDPGIESQSWVIWDLQGQQPMGRIESILTPQGNMGGESLSDLSGTGKETVEEGGEINGRSWHDLIEIGEDVLIKTTSLSSQGTIGTHLTIKSQRCDKEKIKEVVFLKIFIIWKGLVILLIWFRFRIPPSIIFHGDTIWKNIFGRSGNYEGIFELGGKVFWNGYKRRTYFVSHFITFWSNTITKAVFFFSFVSSTMQSQLVGKSGEMENGEGARKRLRILFGCTLVLCARFFSWDSGSYRSILSLWN